MCMFLSAAGECILVFRSESFLDSAINGWNIQVPNNAVYRVQRFNSLLDNRDEVLLGQILCFPLACLLISLLLLFGSWPRSVLERL